MAALAERMSNRLPGYIVIKAPGKGIFTVAVIALALGQVRGCQGVLFMVESDGTNPVGKQKYLVCLGL